MKLFSSSQIATINKVAEISKASKSNPKKVDKNITSELSRISQQVVEYFKDSEAILITTRDELHSYIDKVIEAGIFAYDTETTGLDRFRDHIVGSSLYYPGGVECYIPNKHLVPIFDQPYKNQLDYEDVKAEFDRLVSAKCKLILFNADFDLAVTHIWYKVDFMPIFYFDCYVAWKCLKENELHNGLKELYNKYVLGGKGDPKKFTDFFKVSLFPYCKPQIAKLYAANDAKITFIFYEWLLPYVTKDNSKCKEHHLERIADLIWNIEFPMVKICQTLFRTGIYLDTDVSNALITRYHKEISDEEAKLAVMVQEIIDKNIYKVPTKAKKPFNTGKDFNCTSPLHVKYLLYTLMGLPDNVGKKKGSTDKDVLNDINLPITNQILKVRSLSTLINTFVDKLPNSVTPDGRIHAQFNSVIAATGRMSSSSPNLQNIPSHAVDIRHMFRATPGYVLISSDYSAQEPRVTAFISGDPKMQQAFRDGRDVYATVASFAFGVPYEQCLEFHPETHEYQPEGKQRRNEAKFILLGISYGRSVPSIADQLYGKRTDMSDEEKVSKAQEVYDKVLNSFPHLRNAMIGAENQARTKGYVETILGRRRHLPNMQLPKYEFTAMPGYVNPDIDPLDLSTLDNKDSIPLRIVKQLTKEFESLKYWGQVVKRTKELAEQKIRVINNKAKIAEESRKTLNSVIQGSAADQTKMAMIALYHNEEWKKIGGRLLIPVHDELIAEVPEEYKDEGGRILSQTMIDAASFLPFPSKCDVEMCIHWYGLAYPCEYDKPSSLDNMSDSNVKWIQYMLYECEYKLPTHKEEFGENFRGDVAKGIDGIYSDEVKSYIHDYMSKYNITDDASFINHIEKHVYQGTGIVI